MNKPREYWIDLDSRLEYSTWNEFTAIETARKVPNSVHVIEKTSYDKLLKQALRLRQSLSKVNSTLSINRTLTNFDKYLEGKDD